MKKKNNNREFLRNNKGAALISVMIAVAFITILASSLLYINYKNYQMKSLNLQSKNNFYEADGELTKVLTSFRGNVIKASNPKDKIGEFYTTNPANNKSTYDVSKIVAIAYPGTTGTTSEAVITRGDDKFTFKSLATEGNITAYKDTTNNSIMIYELSGFEVIHENSKDKMYNKVKTDITMKIQEETSSSDPGGVGEFSMLMDSTLDLASSEFGCLYLYGNTFLSSYGTGNANIDGKYYVKPADITKGDAAAMKLGKESKLNAAGEYTVIFGDVVLDDKATLYVNGSLVVYGNLYLKGQSTLICDGQIYMLQDDTHFLPGRDAKTEIKCDDGLAKHIYPSSTTIEPIAWEKYVNFCQTINLCGSNESDITADKRGLLNKITKDVTCTNGKKINITNVSDGDHIKMDENFKINYNTNPKISTYFYDQPCGFAIHQSQTINNDYNHYLVLSVAPDTVVRQANINTTIISKYPMKVDQVHDIALTKIGSETFNFLTIPSNIEGSTNKFYNKYYDTNIHQLNFDANGNGSGKLSPGDFFESNCNQIVNDMLNAAVGGAGGPTRYYSSIQFDGFSKDWE